MPDLREPIQTALTAFAKQPLRRAAHHLFAELGYRVADETPYEGRIILVFRPDPAATGTTTGRDGWSMEKKIIFDEDDREPRGLNIRNSF
jgi:hypothetical protein